MRKWTFFNCFGMAIGLLCMAVTAAGAQTEPAGSTSAPQAAVPQVSTRKAQVERSLGEELNGMNVREVHIFFIHGIGSEGPNSHDSELLRKSICAYVKNCVKPEGEQVGGYDYADGAKFGMNEAPPTMRYMGRPVWNSPEEWHAAAPFVVHYKLARTSGRTIYLDELNWWPLVFALKCRQIIASDALLAGPAAKHIQTCSTREPDPAAPGRFISYDWINPDEAKQLLTQPKRAALINRTLKMDITDWGFADAVASLGPLHDLLVQGIRQLILKAVLDSPMTVRDLTPTPLLSPVPDQDFVIVSQSLGSYLIFSALSVNEKDRATPILMQAAVAYMQVLRQTALVYFFANQVRMLELANLEESPTDNFVSHLEDWGKLRCDYEMSAPGADPNAPCRLPKIVALSDPSDLLTWRVPKLTTVDVQNVYVKNAIHWFWLLENPIRAHLNYSTDKRAIREMLYPTAAPDLEK
jgi:hypothetical protein